MKLPAPLKRIARHVAVVSARRHVADLLPEENANPRVVFAGSQKQGKSSLINTMLGAPLLPVDSLPATATACQVEFGPVEQAAIFDGVEWRAIPFEERATYMDQNLLRSAKPPAIVRLSYPSQFLASLTLIDTAGTGSVFQGHTQSARDSLSLMDLLVLVCSVHKPLGEEDLLILESARVNGTGVVCVITKADEAQDASDSDDVLEHTMAFVKGELRKSDVECHAVFAVSAFNNDVPGAEFAGSVDALRTYLVDIAENTQVRSLMHRCRSLLNAGGVKVGDANRLILETEARLSLVSTAIEEEQSRIAAELSAALLESQSYLDDANRSLAEFVRSSGNSFVMALVPAASDVNEPDQIPNAWRILCAKAPTEQIRVVERLRVLLSNVISDGSMRLGLNAPSALAVIQAAVDGMKLPDPDLSSDPPQEVLEEPGLFAVTLELHGRYISKQISKLVRAEFERNVAKELTEFGRSQISRLAQQAESEAQTKAHGASADASEDVNHVRSALARLSEARRAVGKSKTRLGQRVKKLKAAGSILESALTAIDGDETNTAPALANLAALEMSGHERQLLDALGQYLDGQFAEAAETLTKTSVDEALHAPDIARSYWICQCRSLANGHSLSENDGKFAVLDAVGAAAFLLINACVEPASTGGSPAGALPKRPLTMYAAGTGPVNLEYACEALLVQGAAGELRSARLSTLGLPAHLVFLREQLRERVTSKTSIPLATFAAQHADVLAAPEAEIDLMVRLRAYARGATPDPRNIPSLRSYVIDHGWRFLASA